jgi:hypothetical protein
MGKRLEAEASYIWDHLNIVANLKLSNEEQKEFIREELWKIAKSEFNRGMKQMANRIYAECDRWYDEIKE